MRIHGGHDGRRLLLLSRLVSALAVGATMLAGCGFNGASSNAFDPPTSTSTTTPPHPVRTF